MWRPPAVSPTSGSMQTPEALQPTQQEHELPHSASAAIGFSKILPTPGSPRCTDSSKGTPRSSKGSSSTANQNDAQESSNKGDQKGHQHFPSEQVEEASPKPCHQKLHLLLEEPDSGVAARAFSICVLSAIVMSIAGFILQTIPSLKDFIVLQIVEIGTTIFFTFEYLLRLYACNAFGKQTRLGFLKTPLNILDLVALLPWYLEVSIQSLGAVKPLRVLRSVRLIRLFRIFKLSRYSVGMNLMVKAIVGSMHSLAVMGFFLSVAVVLFSSLVYYAERTGCPDVTAMTQERWKAYREECVDSSEKYDLKGDLCCNDRGAASGFPSIALSFWWAIVTMATVGYGDMVPLTTPGRIVGCFTILAGIVLIALPVAIVGGKFQMAYDELELEERQNARKRRNTRSASTCIIKVTDVDADDGDGVDDLPHDVSKPAARATDVKGTSDSQDLVRQIGAAQKQSLKSKPFSPMLQRLALLRSKLRQLERSPHVSQSAQEQIRVLLELFDHLDKAERRLGNLRERDKALEDCVRRELAEMVRWWDGSCQD